MTRPINTLDKLLIEKHNKMCCGCSGDATLVWNAAIQEAIKVVEKRPKQKAALNDLKELLD